MNLFLRSCLVLSLLLFIAYSVTGQALQGNYTIGGQSPNYPSFTTAVNALKTNGISGKVVFKVRNGTYSEQISLSSFTGSSCTNTVTFESESGDSSSVILSAPNTSTNYVVQLNGADGIIFRKVTMRSVIGVVIDIRGGSDCNQFLNNRLAGIKTNNTSEGYSIVSLPYDPGQNNRNIFQNNLFEDGSYGVYAFGSSNRSSGLVIENNIFRAQTYRGVYIYYNDSVRIVGNDMTINGSTTNSNVYGIYLQSVQKGFQIIKNKIFITNAYYSSYGVSLESAYETAANKGTVANNFIRVSSMDEGFGIYQNNSDYLQILYNNISVNSAGTNKGYGIYYYANANNLEIKNNIFANLGGGFAVYAVSTNSTMQSDYNDYYTTGPIIGYWNGPRVNLTEWKTFSGKDAHSLSLNPFFKSMADLHVGQTDLDGKATPIALVTDDIDGESRNATTPDIGADEFTPAAYDAGITLLNAPGMPFLHGNQKVSVTLKNYGTQPLTSAVIHWQVNGQEQSVFNFSGSVAPGASTGPLEIGSYNFGLGTAYNFVLWTTAPNGTADVQPANDTAKVAGIYAGMSGNYTIGGTAPTFATVVAAVDALNKGGVLGAVNFKIRAGTYAGQVSLGAFAGTSCSNPVVFESESGDTASVKLTGNPSDPGNYVIQLNGADGITFSKLTIRSLSGIAVDIRGGADCNQFLNTHLIGIDYYTNQSSYAVLYSPSSANNRIILRNNLIEDGSYGLLLNGNSSSAHSSGLVVEGNVFRRQSYMGVSSYNTDSVSITGNDIQLDNSLSSSRGIDLQYCNKGFQLVKNKINLTNGSYGIYLIYSNGTATSKATVINNFVRAGNTTVSNCGIFISSCDYVQVFSNSVNAGSTIGNKGIGCFYSPGQSFEVKNNIFSNPAGGYAVFAGSTNTTIQSDYNNYYTTGAILGYWNGDQSTLAAWKTISGKDANSLSVNPLFKSVSDLHVSQTDLNGKATPLAQVTDDIDGEPRNATAPDIGADEFMAATSDAGVTLLNTPVMPFLHGNQKVSVILKNYGTQPLTSAVVRWKINGLDQPVFNFSGSVAPGASTAPVEIGTYNFGLGTAYSFTLWTELPNGAPDVQPANDTAKVVGIYAGMSGNYTIGGAIPTFTTVVAAVDALNKGGVVGTVNFRIRTGNYPGQVSLGAFPGTSCNTPVVFESESGDTASVKIIGNTSDPGNYIVQLNGADGVTFSKLTIKSLYGAAVDIQGGADCNQFLSNHLMGISNGVNSDFYSVLYMPNDAIPSNKNIFRNNLIEDGSYGMRFVGNSAVHSSGLVIEGNVFRKQYYAGISSINYDSIRIAGNEISLGISSSYYFGIDLRYCNKGFQILKNKISLSNAYYGIYLDGASETVANKGMVANNFISVNSTNDSYGIYQSSGDYIQILYNNINVSSSGINKGYGIQYYGTNLEVKNNIFANLGGGYAVYAGSTGTSIQSDYNDFYTTGAYLGYWNAPRANLTEWRMASSRDAHSLSVNPFFKSATDLHITQSDLRGKATPIAQVTDDIDGEPRNATTPDIGADEFVPAASDAGITLLNAPVMPFLHGNQKVSVTLKNYGTQTLSSAAIHWKINGTDLPTFNFSGGSVAPGATTQVDIGSYNFVLGTAYSFTLWTEAPNGAADIQPANDTAKVAGIYAGMSGNYIIGGTAPTFATIVAATDALNRGGVVGPVNFKIRTGIYPGQISLGAFLGTSCNNPVVFESENGDTASVILTGTGATYYTNNYAVQLNGADGIVFRKMTIRSALGIVINILGGSNCNQFVGNRLVGVNAGGSSNDYAIVYSPGDQQTADNNNVFRNNTLEDGSSGIVFYGTSATRETGTVIESNLFKNQNTGCINLYYNDSIRIAGNEMVSNLTTFDGGIYLEGVAKGYQIVKNKITPSYGYYGIQLYSTAGTAASKAIIANNFIRINNSSTADCYGIYEYNVDNTQIFNNNVSVNSTTASKGSGIYYYYYGSNLEVKNNIFANLGGGYAVYVYSAPATFQSDYNNYYTTGATVGYWNGPRATLADWKAASTQDAHSLSLNPLFKSATDLHVTQVGLQSKATPLTQVTDDIDGDPRNPATPDIGADEFSGAAIARNLQVDSLVEPVTACGLGSATTVKIKLTNAGAQTETKFAVAYIMNNGTPVVENVDTLSIKAGQSAYYSFKTPAPISKAGIYTFTVYVSLLEDQVRSNDTLKNIAVQNIGIVLPVTLTLPANNATNLPLGGLTFSWSADTSATAYDLYLWRSTDPVPATPMLSNLASTTYAYYSSLQYNTLYRWKIRARNTCSSAESTVSSFSTVSLPDLRVDTVAAPAEAYAGTNIPVYWRVTNMGKAGTGSTGWIDRVYLSTDRFLDTSNSVFADKLLGEFSNLRALDPDSSYIQNQLLKLPLPPEVQDGNYYLIVVTDHTKQLGEANENNNITVSAAPLKMIATSPADLTIDVIHVPATGFAGRAASVSWKIKNAGGRVTTVSQWTDRVYVSASPVFSAGSALAQDDFVHNGALQPDSAYTQTQSIVLPAGISGSYYIHIYTDVNKQVPEGSLGGEDNNTGISDPFYVNLRMPADLLVAQLTAPAQASAGQKANIKWTVKNQGDTAIQATGWYDKIYVSTLPAFDAGNATLAGSYYHAGALEVNGEYSNSVLLTTPIVPRGNYYVYVVTDAENAAAEYDESNNSRRSSALVQIGILDLQVNSVSVSGGENPGQSLHVGWYVQNAGSGATETASWTDRIFLSPNPTYTPDNSIWFDVKYASQTLAPGGYVYREIDLKVPDIVSGIYYAYVYTDFTNAVYEGTFENNNVARSSNFSNIVTGVPVNDIGVSELVAPKSDCGLTASETVTVRITNYGNQTHTGFNLGYRLNNNAVVVENIGSLTLLPASSLVYSFNTKANLSASGSYTIKVFTALANDALRSNDTVSAAIQQLPALSAPANLLPQDGAANLDRPVNFSWSAVLNAATYDLFVWKATDPMPATPVAAGLSQINFTWDDQLQYGAAYKWMVKASSSRCQVQSATQTFTLRNLPDLVVDGIIVPTDSGRSETAFSVSWIIRNKGLGATGSVRWYESLYLAESSTDRSGDSLIASFENVSALDAGLSYTHPLYTFVIPPKYQGKYYLVVKTDITGRIEETTDTNNVRVIPITIALLPPPDLQVDSLSVAPGSAAFSEDTITIGWSVYNRGSGPTTVASWVDHVYLSKSAILNTNTATRLGVFIHTGFLNVNDRYKRIARFKLPAYIEGDYFIHVVTDATDKVYEYVRENNNVATWNNLRITMLPNPDLRVTSVTAPNDTVSNNQNLSLQWITKNEGAAAARPVWVDNLRLTGDTANGYTNYAGLGYYSHTDTLQSLSATGSQKTITIPQYLPEGKYFFYGVADIYNAVFERDNESDNVSPYSAPLYVVNPDLKPLLLQAPATAQSEQSIALSWTVGNAGQGGVYNVSWSDFVYLSKDAFFDGSDLQLAAVNTTVLLLPNGQYTKQQTVTLPRGISGTYYLIVVTDRYDGVFEKNESNNQLAVPLAVTIAPWPDLQVTDIRLPAADTAGTAINFTYTVKNAGKAKIDNKSWQDVFYLVPVKSTDLTNAIYLASVSKQLTLDSGQSNTTTVLATLPVGISGKYYLVGVADNNDNIYEYTSEGNNLKVSDTSVVIAQLPNVDLYAAGGQVVADSLTPGQTVSVEWSATNYGITPTVIPEWEDAVYLSNNKTLDASDRLLGSWKISKSLQPGASYSYKTTVTIPNDASGTLYFLVNVDRLNQQNDIARGNNTRALDIIVKDKGQVVDSGGGVVIIQPAPSDLVPLQFEAASTVTSGQPLTITYTVKNVGTGTTNSLNWTDRVYLSTDYELNGNDILLGSFNHVGKLATGAQYAYSEQIIVPSYVKGNYVLIFKTDDFNNVYELQGENNNLAVSNLLISQQLPCDLVVTQVTPPAGLKIAGQPVTINWTVRNTGKYPTDGYFRDAVYLSKDTVWDVNDELLGTSAFNYYNVPVQGSVARSLTAKLINVATGNYYVIVKTDVLNNVYEIDETNNLRASDSTLMVDVKQLTMGTTATDTLPNNERLYYRINIPAAQQGQTMSLSLQGDSAKRAVNRLYLRYSQSPAPNEYDFASEIPFSAGQEIIVPELKAGTYYILATGNDPATNYQPVSLLARIIPFQITRVDAQKGGNTGAVTVKISGAKFDSTTTFYLQSGAPGTISSSRIYFTNSTQVFATFNLLNAKPGLYEVVARKANGDSAKFPGRFEVVTGSGSATGSGNPGSGTGFVCQVVNIGFEDELETGYQYPPSTRAMRLVGISIYYANKGNVDIPIPRRFLTALKNNVPLALTPEALAASLGGLGSALGNILANLVLDFDEPGSPPGILRPGASGYKKVYTMAYQSNIGSIDILINK